MKKFSFSFLEGMSSILDIAGVSTEVSGVHASDADAIRSDWEAVGNDIRDAMNQY